LATMPEPTPRDPSLSPKELAQAKLRARAARIARMRQRVIAASLATFALAFGAIAWDGSMGEQSSASSGTQTTASAASGSSTSSSDDQTSSSENPTTSSDDQTTSSDDSTSSSSDDSSSSSSSPSTVTTGQS
jgi:hypothetical protein